MKSLFCSILILSVGTQMASPDQFCLELCSSAFKELQNLALIITTRALWTIIPLSSPWTPAPGPSLVS